MNNEWKDCSPLSDFAAAVARGDEIEVDHNKGVWVTWAGGVWYVSAKYRCRQTPKMKTVLMREAFYWNGTYGWYTWRTKEVSYLVDACFVHCTGNERTEEVPDND